MYFRYIEDFDHEMAEAELQADYMLKYGDKPRFTGRVRGDVYDLLEDWLDD